MRLVCQCLFVFMTDAMKGRNRKMKRRKEAVLIYSDREIASHKLIGEGRIEVDAARRSAFHLALLLILWGRSARMRGKLGKLLQKIERKERTTSNEKEES